MRVALVHDYLTQMGGAERVLLALHDLFPAAPIYTSIYAPARVDARFHTLDIRTTALQRLPRAEWYHKALLPAYPLAFESLDLRAYDLILSDSSAFAKGIIPRPDALHVCYCHAPMRFAWNYDEYVEGERLGPVARALLRPVMLGLRVWDVTSAARVDAFLANSPAVAARIAKYYRRTATVLPPPVDVGQFALSQHQGDYFLVVSRLVPYKRLDLAVTACARAGVPLWVVGTGRDEARLRGLAGPTVRFLGQRTDAEVCDLMARCRALIFPGEDDFGLAPVEAQAAGRPVIAYGRGGALSSVVDGVTGLFFAEQTPEALVAALRRFEAMTFDTHVIRRHAETFDTACFQRRLLQFIEARLAVQSAISESIVPASVPAPVEEVTTPQPTLLPEELQGSASERG